MTEKNRVLVTKGTKKQEAAFKHLYFEGKVSDGDYYSDRGDAKAWKQYLRAVKEVS